MTARGAGPPGAADEVLRSAVNAHRAGRLDEAEAIYRRVIKAHPEHAEALHLLGLVRHQGGRSEDAVGLIERAIACDAAIARYHNSLGVALYDLGRIDEAEASYRRALTLSPDHVETLVNLANALKEQGRLDEAVACLERALELRPDYALAHNNLANVKKDRGAYEAAIEGYRQALALAPDYVEARHNLSVALLAQGRLDEAEASCRKALALRPDYAEAHSNLGNVLAAQGRSDDAIAAIRRALEIKPDHAKAHSNLLFNMNYAPQFADKEILGESRRWNNIHAVSRSRDKQAFANVRDPARPLRIGYVSRDFRAHSVAYFIEALLAGHDPAEVETLCYADVPWPDDTTRRLQKLPGKWRDINGMDDEQVADRVRSDAIDILVDLAGHTRNNRLLMFARKPAPIQVTYIGYCNTTGLEAIDYRLTDALADPVGAEAFNSEELVRLPRCFLCYTPPTEAPVVGSLPARQAGRITFGSFNNLPKVTPEVIALWSEILVAIPSARLVLKARSLSDRKTREHYAQMFAQNGVAHTQIGFIGAIPSSLEHMALYGKIDIGLDPFPYNGATTTCEAMWMGVPVIALAGRAHAGRVGVSLLSACGLGELIAETPREYVDTALRLASERDRLSTLRLELRSRMATSPLCDQAGLARAVEHAYRTMWRRWCESVEPHSPKPSDGTVARSPS